MLCITDGDASLAFKTFTYLLKQLSHYLKVYFSVTRDLTDAKCDSRGLMKYIKSFSKLCETCTGFKCQKNCHKKGFDIKMTATIGDICRQC